MGRINQSYCYPMYNRGGIGLEELIAGTAEIGFAAVEIWGRAGAPFDDIVKLSAKHGLRVASMVGHGGGLCKPAAHEQIEAELRESISLAADLNIPGLICLSGNREGMDDYTGMLNSAEVLKRVAPFAEEKGVNLNVELLNSKVNHPDYMADRTLWAVCLCELVQSPRVKILYDIYHMAIMEGDLIRTIRDWGKYFGHYHTAGNPGRNDIDDQQEIYYPAVMRAIVETGYDLFVAHEFAPKKADTPADVLASLKQAFDACNV